MTDDPLTDIRESGYVQAILHYRDGSVYFYTWKHAYIAPYFQNAVSEFTSMMQELIGKIGPANLRGHDDCPFEFLKAQCEPHKLEWVSNGIPR